MTRAQADALVMGWDATLAEQGRRRREAGEDWLTISADIGKRRALLWRVLDCLAGWRPYDAEVAAALDTMKQTPQVREIREICEEAPREY